MITGWIPLLLFATYMGLTLAAVFTNHRLLRMFVAKRPDLVRKHFPEAAVEGRNPTKLFFFLRPSTATLLANDQQLSRLRNRLVCLLYSLLTLLFLIVILMLIALNLKP